jgi:anti-sigma regulatory factor (Ser/Thr protein kinase)
VSTTVSPRHFSLHGRASLRAARDFAQATGSVLRFWNLPEPRVQLLELAVAEMATNVCRHGYRDREGGPMTLQLDLDAAGLRLALRDEGLAFDPTRVPEPPAPDPADPRTWPESGLGLGLIRSAGRLAYASDAGANCISLRVEEPFA